jgi:hypothetical protein
MNNHTNGIVRHFEEHQREILTAKVLRKARGRAADMSASLTRTGAAQATAELLNEATMKAIGLLYEVDADGVPANVDSDGKILIPLPWGSVGRPKYALRRTEGDSLRKYIQHLEAQRRPAVRLFYFENGRWYLDCWTYPTKADALAYWRLVAVNASVWRRFSVQRAS